MLALALALQLAAAPTASGPTDFDLFKSVCVATDARPDAAMAAADKAGWMPVPQQMLDSFPLPHGGKPQGRMRTSADGMFFIVTATMVDPATPNMKADFCAMAEAGSKAPVDFSTPGAALAGVKGQTDPSGTTFYPWREENGLHVSVPLRGSSTAELLGHGGLKFLGVKQDASMSMVIFGVAEKQP